MPDNKIKIKFNINYLKWAVTIFFLLINILFVFYETEDKICFICFGIVTNCLAIFSFVMLSIFPRIYFVFDENGCSYQDRNGNEKNYVEWGNIKSISYIYVLGIPGGLEFKYNSGYENKWVSVAISPKQAKLVYNTFPKVKALIDIRCC